MPGGETGVLIIGAGVAGLAAARTLATAGVKVAILEARDRLGGRILPLRDPALPLPVELGAEFIHGKPPEIWKLVDSGVLLACDVTGEHQCFEHGQLAPCGAFEKLEPIFERMAGAPEQSFLDFLERCDCDQDLKPWAAVYVEGFNAARKEKVSVRSLVQGMEASKQSEGDRSFRILNGYGQVARALWRGAEAASAVLHLNTVVTAVRWRAGQVQVTAYSPSGQVLGSFDAVRAIITLPIGVLKAGALQFAPQPPALSAGLQAIEMGQAVRITLRFRRRFWEDTQDVSSVSFIHSLDEWMPTWWTVYPARAGILTGWAGGARRKLRWTGRNVCSRACPGDPGPPARHEPALRPGTACSLVLPRLARRSVHPRRVRLCCRRRDGGCPQAFAARGRHDLLRGRSPQYRGARRHGARRHRQRREGCQAHTRSYGTDARENPVREIRLRGKVGADA